MAGNREIFEQAINQGHSAAWDQNWNAAISSYARAVQEVPDDAEAHNSLGLALLQAKRYSDALKVYSRAHQLAPEDPIPLEKSADVLERLGRLNEAAQQYVTVAEMYLAARDLDKAIANWERATRLTPGLLQIHFRLAQSYERTGQRSNAVREYLTLAFNFRGNNDTQRALQAVERALRLEPTNPQALNTKQALQTGATVFVPKEFEMQQPESRAESFGAASALADLANSDPDGPIGESTSTALADLAEQVLEGDLTAATTAIIQGIELHKAGEYQAALDLYKRADANGFRNEAMNMVMGAIYVKQQQWDDAARLLTRARNTQSYRAGASHGMGQVLQGQTKYKEASVALMEALRTVDTSLAMGKEEQSQLDAVYNALIPTLDRMEPPDLSRMNQRLIKWMVGPDWKRRVAETRRQLTETLSREGAGALTEVITEGSDEITDMVITIDSYMRQGLFTLAMDEALPRHRVRADLSTDPPADRANPDGRRAHPARDQQVQHHRE